MPAKPNYRSIKQTLFEDPEFLRLPRNARDGLVYLRLMARNIIALYRPDWDRFDELLELTSKPEREAVLDALAQPKASGMPWVIVEGGYAWVVNGFAHELGSENGKVSPANACHVAAVARALDSIPPENTLKARFVRRYHHAGFGEKFDAMLDTLSHTLPDTLSDTPIDREGEESVSVSVSGTAYCDDNSALSPDDPAKTKLNCRILQWRDWFYDTYRAVTGEIHPLRPVDKRVAPKDRNAILAWLRAFDAGTMTKADLRDKLTNALAGQYRGVRVPASPAEFNMHLGSCVDTNLMPTFNRDRQQPEINYPDVTDEHGDGH